MSIKGIVRNAINATGFDIVRARVRDGEIMTGLFEVFLEYFILAQGKGSILQVGANDGVRADPVSGLIRKYDLDAVLIEPLPDMFEDLQKNYLGCANVRFENVAISTKDGTAALFRIKRDCNSVPDWAHGIASFDKNHLLRLANAPDVADRKSFGEAIEPVSVPVTTVSTIVERHPELQRMLALQIDTEGHDFVVIQSAMAAGCRPTLIHYEDRSLSLADQRACRAMLMDLGYGFVSEIGDAIAVQRGALPAA
jgi:FkbM family methyltransferase